MHTIVHGQCPQNQAMTSIECSLEPLRQMLSPCSIFTFATDCCSELLFQIIFLVCVFKYTALEESVAFQL